MSSFLRALCLVLPVLLVACGGETTTPAGTGGGGTSSSGPSVTDFLGDPGGAPIEVEAARALPGGSEVVVTGRVKDFVTGFASFTLIDHRFTPCDEREDDECPTPWDYCCDPASEVAAGTVAIELRDGARPLRADLKGTHQFDHLVTAVVKGKTEKDEAGNVIVVAETLKIIPRDR